jgi:hypothetical protein
MKQELIYSLPIRKIPRKLEEKFAEHIKYLRENGIIPLLESEISEFETKFQEAEKYYSLYQINIIYLLGFNKIDPQKSMARSFLSLLSSIRNASKSDIPQEIRSSFLNAISRLEDYFLLASDPKIDVNKSKYIPILDASFRFWVSFIAINEALSEEKYKNKIPLLIDKSNNATEQIQKYVIMIAEDHGRSFSHEVNMILENMESHKEKIVTETADELIKEMRKELAVRK